MNKYLEKIALNRAALEAKAKELGVVTVPGSQWRRAIREGRKAEKNLSLDSFKHDWKYRIKNTFTNKSGKEYPFLSPVKDDIRDPEFHQYNRATDALLSLRNKGHFSYHKENSSKGWVVPKGFKGHSNALPIDMQEHGGRAYLHSVGADAGGVISEGKFKGKGFYRKISKDLHEELRKRGYDKLYLDPQSPVWERNYGLREDVRGHYIPL